MSWTTQGELISAAFPSSSTTVKRDSCYAPETRGRLARSFENLLGQGRLHRHHLLTSRTTCCRSGQENKGLVGGCITWLWQAACDPAWRVGACRSASPIPGDRESSTRASCRGPGRAASETPPEKVLHAHQHPSRRLRSTPGGETWAVV